MKNIETKTTIKAPINQVWDTLMNFENYPSWNSFIPSITGEPVVGKQISVSIHPPGKNPMSFTPTVLINKSQQEFKWKGKLGVAGIFDGEHYFQLTAINSNETQFIHGENFSGILVPFLFKMIKESTIQGFEEMNQSLKSHLEN
ncbi:MAG: SRPBCC family protein [Salibacteraceae bacterium]